MHPVFAQDERTRKFFAIQEVIEHVQRQDQIQFSVMLSRYFVEGRSYFASMLTITPGYVFDLKQTNDGFEGYFLFPKDIIHEEAQNDEVKPGVVKVHLKALLDDIFLIVGHDKSGNQIDLYNR